MNRNERLQQRKHLLDKLVTYQSTLGEIAGIPTYEVQEADIRRLIDKTQQQIDEIDGQLSE